MDNKKKKNKRRSIKSKLIQEKTNSIQEKMMIAVGSDDLDTLKHLLTIGATFDLSTFHFAATKNSVLVFEHTLFHTKFSNIEYRYLSDLQGRTYLHFASLGLSLSVMTIALSHEKKEQEKKKSQKQISPSLSQMYSFSTEHIEFINRADNNGMTALSICATMMFLDGIHLLVDAGAVISYDNEGHSPMKYLNDNLINLRSDMKKLTNKKTALETSLQLERIISTIAFLAPSVTNIGDIFHHVTDKDARDACVRSIGISHVLKMLTNNIAHDEFINNIELFNDISISVSRCIKKGGMKLDISNDIFSDLLLHLIKYGNSNSLNSWASLLSRPQYISNWIDSEKIHIITRALSFASRITLFAHEPNVDYATEFIQIFGDCCLKMFLLNTSCFLSDNINTIYSSSNHNIKKTSNRKYTQFDIATSMDNIWYILNQSLYHVDEFIEETERFSILIRLYYLWMQVFFNSRTKKQIFNSNISHTNQHTLSNDIHLVDQLQQMNISDSELLPRERLFSTNLLSLQDEMYHALSHHSYYSFNECNSLILNEIENSSNISIPFLTFYKRHQHSIEIISNEDENVFHKYFSFLLHIGNEMNQIRMKKRYIRSSLGISDNYHKNIQITINRIEMTPKEILEFWGEQIMAIKPHYLQTDNFSVRFINEPGEGDGPLRELFTILASEIFTLQSSFFSPTPDGTKWHLNYPSPLSSTFRFYEMIGRTIGLCILYENPLNVHFSRPLLRFLLSLHDGITSDWKDYDDFDHSLHSSLKKMLGNPKNSSYSSQSSKNLTSKYHPKNKFVTKKPQKHLKSHSVSSNTNDIYKNNEIEYEGGMTDQELISLDLRFVLSASDSLHFDDIELVENGHNIIVNKKNIENFVFLYTKKRIWGQNGIEFASSIRKGFNTIIPSKYSSLFTIENLDYLISGPTTKCNLHELYQHCTYNGYNKESPVIKWFWNIVFHELTEDEIPDLLQFWSGSSLPPLWGFNPRFTDDETSWSISFGPYSQESLPRSSTCSYTLTLPAYHSRELLLSKLCAALRNAKIGFSEI